MSYYVTENSFGSEIPENWGQIADYLNQIIDERGVENDHNACNEIWEEFWQDNLNMTPEMF